MRAGVADWIAARRRIAIAFALAGCLVALVAMSAGAGAATSSRTTVVLGSTATVPDPSCPELPCQAVGSVTGFQVSTDQAQPALPGAEGRQSQVLDADPGRADQQAALLLQRLLRHPAAGAPGDPAPRPGHQPASLQPAQSGLDPRAQSLPRPDGQVRRLAEGRKGRHRRAHHPDLGAGLRPGPRGAERLASQPRTGPVHQLPPPSARAKPRKKWANEHLRLSLLNRPRCSTRRR